MKKLVIAIVAIASLALVGLANGSAQQSIYYRGILCKTDSGTGAVMCASDRNYGMGLSRHAVLVMKGGKTIFQRYIP